MREPNLDSTVLAPRPEMTDASDSRDDSLGGSSFGDGLVFDDDLKTTTTQRKPGGPVDVRSSDVSLIEAESAASDELEAQRITSFGDGAMVEDYNPPTEVLRLAFSEDGSPESVTPSAPVAVRKWKMGGEDASAAAVPPAAHPPAAPLGDPPRPPAVRSPAAPSLPRAPAPEPRARPSQFTLPPTELGQGGAGTRVDAVPSAGAKPVSLDVDELRRTLEEAEKLLKTVKSQVSVLDLESRGTNAQLAAALHRIGEALSMLKR